MSLPLSGDRFDAVVMLTRSDWYSELRSNRYHYASRFAEHLPVWFVQPDLPWLGVRERATELDGVRVLQVPRFFGWRQSELLGRALVERGVSRPLMWVYDHRFADFIRRTRAPATVYHATEDFFSPEFYRGGDTDLVREVVASCDLVVAVAEGVLDDYREQGGYEGPALVLTNGCDDRFFREGPPVEPQERTAIYQGGISRKVDFELFTDVVQSLPNWTFRLCGPTFSGDVEGEAGLRRLLGYPNVEYLGSLPVESLRREMKRATVGLIPLLRSEWIRRRTFPLKGFEYVACGLPVVSVEIDGYRPYSDVIHMTDEPERFAQLIEDAAPSRSDPDALKKRTQAAASVSYDSRFAHLWQYLHGDGFSASNDSLSIESRAPRPADLLGGAFHSVLATVPEGWRWSLIRWGSAAYWRSRTWARRLGLRGVL